MSRLRPPVKYGPDNNRFNGGLCFHDGRWIVCCKDGTKMLFSRAVMCARERRILDSNEIVHHKDEDITNDDELNLEIVTRSDHVNMHRKKLLQSALPKICRGENHPRSKVTNSHVVEIRENRNGESYGELATRLGVRRETIWAIATGRQRRAG